MQNRTYATILLLLCAGMLKAQHVQTDTTVVRSDTTIHKPSFFVLPAMAYSQEKGLKVGAAILYSFYLDKRNPDPLTRNSTINLIPAITTESQWKIDLKTDFWTRGN